MQVTAITADDFAGLELEWTRLLGNSSADPLFMSWKWLSTWWSIFCGRESQLRLYQVLDRDGQRVGLAPCWLSRERVKRLIPVRRLQFIGNRWRNDTVAITEYTDFIAHPLRHADVVTGVLEHAAEGADWDEFVMVAVRSDSPTLAVLRELAAARGWLLRISDPTVSYRVSLAGGFDGFLARLSGQTRRQLFNKRQRLHGRAVRRVVADDATTVDRALQTLNQFHLQRWGKPAFSGARLEFQRRICQGALPAAQLRLEVMSVADRPLSIVFDLLAGTTEYNIQSGFDAAAAPDLSPGLMHLGCAIEAAAACGRQWFDLLAGTGRSSDYKRSLADERIELVTVQLVRAKWLASLYRLWDRAPARLA